MKVGNPFYSNTGQKAKLDVNFYNSERIKCY